jgi:F-type H+-transporting ATPase subunit epsilon
MSNSNFQLDIVSPEGLVFTGEVDQVSVPTETGEITILPHHADLYGKVTSGEAIIHRRGKTEYIAILGGFVEVKNGSTTILSNYAVETDKISAAKAKEAKERAEKLLQEKDSEKDFALIERELQKAILELDIAEKSKRRRTVQ